MGARLTVKTTTDRRGEFLFSTVPVGDYLLTVTSNDLNTVVQSVTVSSTSSPTAHIQLASGAALEAVTISAGADTLPVNSATSTTLVNREDIEDTPRADRSNSLAMITDFVPGAYVVHDQLHVRGGHQTTWAVDGVEIPNTNIASNLGPQIDPKDIDYLEVQRGSYEADQGERTYGVFNVVPRTGFERDNEGELILGGGDFRQTNDYLSVGSHTENFGYYASVNGNRSDLGIQTPVAQIIHDSEDGCLLYEADPQDQFCLVASGRHDNYDIPNTGGQISGDVQRETDSFVVASWVRQLGSKAVLTTSMLYHLNQADLDASPADFPISTTDERSSTYVGGQETLRVQANSNDLQVGLLGFSQHDTDFFDVLFNDGSNAPIRQTASPSGTLVAGYIEDSFKATGWLSLVGGVRQAHFSGGVVENATSPRLGMTVLVPRLHWVLRGFYGRFYQAPPLTTLAGPLLAFSQNSNLGFLPLHGERDREYQYGVSIPFHGWTVDADHFRTDASNFFDHNPIGNSNVFLPLTIDGALIRGSELTVRSPRFWSFGRVYLTYSNQSADGFGTINGGLTDFSPPAGHFALDHDQRSTVNAGFEAKLPWQGSVSANIYYGSGFANGEGSPSHLPSHAELSLSAAKSFGQRYSASVTVLNLSDRHLLADNSLTFGGFHYNNPREIFAEVRYRFGY